MSIGDWRRRVAFLLRKKRNLDELEEEMRLHAELRSRRMAEQGIAPEESGSAARRRFGNRTLLKEAVFETWSFAFWEVLWRDLKFAARMLRKIPGFTAVAVITLALGIGANTAVYSVVDAVLLRPLPYPSPERLGSLASFYKAPGQQGMFADQDGRMWEMVRDNAHDLDAAVYSDMSSTVNVGGPGQVQYVQQQRVGSSFFRVLGVEPLLGRGFTKAEDSVGGPAVAVISYRPWKNALHGDNSLLNRPILLRGEPYTVVGVMPAHFRTAALADVWTPLRPSTHGEGANANYQIVVRLQLGTTWPQARAEIDSIGAQRTRTMHFDAGESVRITLLPLQEAITDQIRTPITLLWCAAGVVLFICCINIAGLLLARGSARRQEIATRMALGRGRTQVVRQLLVESILFSLLAGAAGLAIGYAGIVGLRTAVRESLSVWQTVELDARVFCVTCFVAMLATVLVSLYPALQSSRVDLRSSLVDAGGRSVAGRRTVWPRRFLIIGEVALGVMLLVAAGLLARSFFFLRNQAPGFDATHVITATLPLQDVRYQSNRKVNLLFREILSRVRSLPGTDSAAFGLSLPYQRGLNTSVTLPGGSSSKDTTQTYITPGYFQVLRMPMLKGRAFSDLDQEKTKPVAIVNQTFARMFFGGRNPVGRSVNGGKLEIVGLVGDLPAQGSLLGYAPVTAIPTMYTPATQVDDGLFQMLNTWFAPSCLVRSSLPARQTISSMRRAVLSVDPLLPFSDFRSIGQIRSATLARQRFQALLMGGLAGFSLVLAAIGIYGLIAQSVVERTREMGIRIALGATAWQAARVVAWPGIWLAGAGCVLGMLGALAVVHLLRSILWGVSTADPGTFLGTAAVLFGAAVLASFIPAIKVLRMNCAEVLRSE